MDLTEAQLNYIMGSALLLGLVLGWPARTTALALMREYKVLGRLYCIGACCWTGAMMAAASNEIAAYVNAYIQGAHEALRAQDIERLVECLSTAVALRSTS